MPVCQMVWFFPPNGLKTIQKMSVVWSIIGIQMVTVLIFLVGKKFVYKGSDVHTTQRVQILFVRKIEIYLFERETWFE